MDCFDTMKPNLLKLLELVDHVFQTRNDPSQIGFTESDMAKMNNLHVECLQEAENEDGPIAWVAVIPTSLDLMNEFIIKTITERELFDRTTMETPKEAVYLCSAIVLPDFRRKGIALQLSLEAIHAMQQHWSLSAVFVWPFSDEGKVLAHKIADECGLTLYTRSHN